MFETESNLQLTDGLNVIVGENGAGKTAIISAIRQLFHDSESGRYSITSEIFYPFTVEDTGASPFSIRAELNGLDASDK